MFVCSQTNFAFDLPVWIGCIRVGLEENGHKWGKIQIKSGNGLSRTGRKLMGLKCFHAHASLASPGVRCIVYWRWYSFSKGFAAGAYCTRHLLLAPLSSGSHSRYSRWTIAIYRCLHVRREVLQNLMNKCLIHQIENAVVLGGRRRRHRALMNGEYRLRLKWTKIWSQVSYQCFRETNKSELWEDNFIFH